MIFQVWRGEYAKAIDTAADIIAISALALAVTCSTPMEEVLDAISTLARPIRRILPPETLGLMFAMTLRAIPEAARLIVEARTAAKARGLERSPRAVLIPAATRSVGFALQLGPGAARARHRGGGATRASSEKRKKAKAAKATYIEAPPVTAQIPTGTRRSHRKRHEGNDAG